MDGGATNADRPAARPSGPPGSTGLRVAVIGAGWAGLAAAVEAVAGGAAVTLFEMAPQAGGRARTLTGAEALDNGQHILIGAYTDTLALMRQVGADPETLLLRTPLRLRYPDRDTLRLRPGPPLWAFTRAVLGCAAWSWADRLALLMTSGRWAGSGFRCDPSWTVERLCRGLPAAIRADLIDPLCVAALNTPSDRASATVFLRVLKDALFSGPGSADLLLPKAGLSALVPEPALRWLHAHGAVLRTQRVKALAPRADGGGWTVDGEAFDRVVLAASSQEAARLTRDVAPDWSVIAHGFQFEPIITVYARCPGGRLPAPMVALRESAHAPAQFAFDLGQLGQEDGLFSFVISGASGWIERGLDAAAAATLAQAEQVLRWPGPLTLVRVLSEKRATFACTPGLRRPGAMVAPGLWAAGDYLDGPYPATLEGAVRSGRFAARAAVG